MATEGSSPGRLQRHVSTINEIDVAGQTDALRNGDGAVSGPPRATKITVKLRKQVIGLVSFQSSYFQLFSELSGPQEKLTAVCAGAFAIAAGVPLPIIGVIFGRLISSFPPAEKELQTQVAELTGVAIAYFVVTSVYTTLFARTGERRAIQLRHKVFRTLLHVEQSYLAVENLDYNALLRDNIDTVQVGCSEKLGIFVQSISYFVAAFVVGFILNAKLTGILFAAVIPSMVAFVLIGSTYGSKFSRTMANHTEGANAVARGALQAVRTVQAFDMMRKLCSSHRDHLSDSYRAGVGKAVVSAIQLGGAFFVAYAANALAFHVGSHMAATGQSGGNAGIIYAVVFLILDASFVLGQFAPFLEIFARAGAAHATIRERIGRNLHVPAEAQEPGRLSVDLHGQELQTQNVCFTYPTRPDVPVLNGLDIRFLPETLNAVVGFVSRT